MISQPYLAKTKNHPKIQNPKNQIKGKTVTPKPEKVHAD
jgi:hypothetical protein